VQTETWSTGVGTDDEVPSFKQGDEELRLRIQELEEEIRELQTAENNANTDRVNGVVHHDIVIKNMDEDERNRITESSEFADFVERSTKVIERALDQEYDILADYGLGSTGDVDDQAGRRVKEVTQFYSERWSKKRIVSDIHFSPKV